MSLPLTASHRKHAAGIQDYMHRIINFREQVDFEVTFCTMLWLCMDPRRAYRNAEYHSRTKHQWARDDPGFVIVMVALISVSMTSWSVAFGPGSVWGWILGVTFAVCVDFVGVGVVAAGIAWLVVNGRAPTSQGDPFSYGGEAETTARATVEFAYAFDIHCNAYFPMFLLLHVSQYFLLPILISPSFFASMLSCALYGAATSYYWYLTFLGYNALPSLRHTELLVLPVGGCLLLAFCALIVRYNPTVASINYYFGEVVVEEPEVVLAAS